MTPAHPVEPEPRCECRHDGGPIYTLDCPLHRNDPPPQVTQAVESGERTLRQKALEDYPPGTTNAEVALTEALQAEGDRADAAEEALRLQRGREEAYERWVEMALAPRRATMADLTTWNSDMLVPLSRLRSGSEVITRGRIAYEQNREDDVLYRRRIRRLPDGSLLAGPWRNAETGELP